MSILNPVFWLIDQVLWLYFIVVFLAVIMSWLISFNVINTTNRFVAMLADMLYRLTEPALRPIRRFLPSLGGLDISPIVLLLAVEFARRIFFEIQRSIGG
jgi:YggT family protein